MSSCAKCFSQVYTLSFSILSLNSLSISLDFVISFSHSALQCLCFSSFGAGSFQMPIPFVRLHVPQPKTAQLSPGIIVVRPNKAFAGYYCLPWIKFIEEQPLKTRVLNVLNHPFLVRPCKAMLLAPVPWVPEPNKNLKK